PSPRRPSWPGCSTATRRPASTSAIAMRREADPVRSRRYTSAVLRRLRWPVARRLGVHAWGDERSRLTGPGIEYADVREYQWGEDARLIDWNLTARSDRPFVRESHPDRGIDVWLVVDTSRSLDWGTALSLKRETASELVAAAALLLSRHGNRVGAIVFDTELRRVLAPRAAAAEQRARLLADIRRAGASTLEVTTAEPLLPQLVTYLRRRQSRRGHALTEVPA